MIRLRLSPLTLLLTVGTVGTVGCDDAAKSPGTSRSLVILHTHDDLAALFDELGTDATKPLHRVYLTTTANGLKVGFVGLLGAVASTYAPLKTPVTFSLPPGGTETQLDAVKAQLYGDVQKQVDHLRNDLKADLVVALSHSGVDMKDMTKGEDY